MITAKDLHPRILRGEEITPEEIFEAVARHLFEQGRQSKLETEDGRCLYRCGIELSCAVGALIPDSLYRSWMDDREGMTVKNVLADDKTGDASLTSLYPHARLLTDLQHCHDGSVFWKSSKVMRKELDYIRATYTSVPRSVLEDLSFGDR